MMLRMLCQTSISLIIIAAILLVAGGDCRWPQAWIFMAEFAVSNFALGLWLARHDPALLASRLSSPMQRDQQPWDRIFMLSAFLAFIGWMLLIALDARRFRWSIVPLWAQPVGALLIALCMLVCWQTFGVNSFAAPQVRVQLDRAQHVVSNGPYRFVRHPMYAGALLLFVGVPLLLGSWWGLIMGPVATIGIGLRAVGEERMLRRELNGYDDYARRVRFRLIPGVW